MTGIIIVTHGPLAEAFIASAKLIIGDVENIKAIGFFQGQTVDMLKEKIMAAISELNSGDGVLIFTDIFGGSPNNMTAVSLNELGNPKNIKCFVGVNLYILLEAIIKRDSCSFEELVKHISDISKSSIFELSEKLPDCSK